MKYDHGLSFDLKYDHGLSFDLLLFVSGLVGGVFLVMGFCVGCDWRCCYELCECLNGASPIGFVLSLFYMCAFQMNLLSVCVCGV